MRRIISLTFSGTCAAAGGSTDVTNVSRPNTTLMLRSLIYGSGAASKEFIVKGTSSANWRRLSQHRLAYVLQGSRMSPKTLARTTGALSLLVLLGGIVAQGVIANGLVVPRDAAVTATNIVAHSKLWALGFTVFLVEMAAQTAMTTLFYMLLRPANRTAALLSLVFGLVGCTIKTLARAFYYSPLLLLGAASYLTVFDTRSEEHTSELQSRRDLVCRLLLE